MAVESFDWSNRMLRLMLGVFYVIIQNQFVPKLQFWGEDLSLDVHYEVFFKKCMYGKVNTISQVFDPPGHWKVFPTDDLKATFALMSQYTGVHFNQKLRTVEVKVRFVDECPIKFACYPLQAQFISS